MPDHRRPSVDIVPVEQAKAARPRRLALYLGVIALLTLSAPRSHAKKLATNEPQYLMFQLFTAGPGFTTEPDRQAISQLPPAGLLEQQTQNIVNAIGMFGDARHRLGVTVGPIALDYTDDQMRTLIQRSFALATKYRVAIALHIDDSKFWLNRSDLWSNPANVEWLDWNKTTNSGQYINWGTPWKLAPQACFNSPTLLKEVRRVAGSVIGATIAQELTKLHAAGDDALFAGVLVGWETAIEPDYNTRQLLGYCALSNLGYSAATPPPDADGALESVVQSWIGTWSKSLVSAGIPSSRLYSHITFSSQRQFNASANAARITYAENVFFTPAPVAFGTGHRAGFSTYPNLDVQSEIYAAVNALTTDPWASSEGTSVDISSNPPTIAADGMETYLGRMFNHGSAITNVFGWGVGDGTSLFSQVTQNTSALAAYRKFLGGATLVEQPLPDYNPVNLTALQTMIQALPDEITAYQQRHGDMSRITAQVASIQSHIGAGEYGPAYQELQALVPILAGS